MRLVRWLLNCGQRIASAGILCVAFLVSTTAHAQSLNRSREIDRMVVGRSTLVVTVRGDAFVRLIASRPGDYVTWDIYCVLVPKFAETVLATVRPDSVIRTLPKETDELIAPLESDTQGNTFFLRRVVSGSVSRYELLLSDRYDVDQVSFSLSKPLLTRLLSSMTRAARTAPVVSSSDTCKDLAQ